MPDDNAGQPVQPGGSQRATIIAVVSLTVALLLVTPVVLIFAVGAMFDGPMRPHEIKDSKAGEEKTVEFTLKDQQCVIGGTKGEKFAKFSVVFVVSEKDEAVLKCFQEKTPENSHGQLNRIKSEITRIAMGKDYDLIRTAAGTKQISDEIKKSVEGLIAEELGESHLKDNPVIDVIFPVFLVWDLKAQ